LPLETVNRDFAALHSLHVLAHRSAVLSAHERRGIHGFQLFAGIADEVEIRLVGVYEPPVASPAHDPGAGVLEDRAEIRLPLGQLARAFHDPRLQLAVAGLEGGDRFLQRQAHALLGFDQRRHFLEVRPGSNRLVQLHLGELSARPRQRFERGAEGPRHERSRRQAHRDHGGQQPGEQNGSALERRRQKVPLGAATATMKWPLPISAE
jgi:hypothetical protein